MYLFVFIINIIVHRLHECFSDLNDQSHQFRIIQKRLLVRYKDRNPAPLNGLDILFDESYHKLLLLSDKIEALKIILEKQSYILSCYSRLLVVLAGMKYSMTQNDKRYKFIYYGFMMIKLYFEYVS